VVSSHGRRFVSGGSAVRVARPSSYTPKKGAAVLDRLSANEGVAKAGKAVGVCRKTVYNWRDAHPAFKDAFDDVQDAITDDIEATAIQRALAGDTTLLIFLLKSRRREVYGDKVAVTVQLRKKAEDMAEQLGVSADDLIREAELVAAGSWDAWSPQ
jgi:hypothetical protein